MPGVVLSLQKNCTKLQVNTTMRRAFRDVGVPLLLKLFDGVSLMSFFDTTLPNSEDNCPLRVHFLVRKAPFLAEGKHVNSPAKNH